MADNKGFSLVELIIIIALIAVVSGAVIGGYGLASGRDADQCANGIRDMLSLTKSTALSKDRAILILYQDSSGVYAVLRTVRDGSGNEQEKTTQIGRASVTVTYYTSLDAEDTGTVLSDGEILSLTFDRSSGAFDNIVEGSKAGQMCYKIKVVKGSRERVLILVPRTGKFYFE